MSSPDQPCGGKVGMRLLNDSLFDLVKSGQVEPGEAYIKSVFKDDLMTKFEAGGIRFDHSQLSKQSTPAPAPSPMPSQPMASPAAPSTPPAAPTGARPPGPGAALPNANTDSGKVNTSDGGFDDPFEQFKRTQGH